MFPATAEVFLPRASAPKVGDVIVRSDYARTLEAIASGGADVLYGGHLGEMVAEDMAANGGLVTLDDLTEYRIHLREPVRGTYRGYEIVSVAPTSSGGAAIVEMLNILEEFDIASLGFGTVEGVHLLAEAMKIAFADRFEYMGDPAFMEVPVEALTSKEYAASRRGEIDPDRARTHAYGSPSAYVGEGADTTHLTVADRDGSVVSTTQTIHAAFGSKVTTPGSGMLLNNTMNIFDPHPCNANSIAPGKRMVSSMSPTIVMKDGKPYMALGTPGVDTHLPIGASGYRQRHRPRDDTSGGRGGAARVDAGTGSGGGGGHRRRCQGRLGVSGTRRRGGCQSRGRNERGDARSADGHDTRRGMLAGGRRPRRIQRRSRQT